MIKWLGISLVLPVISLWLFRAPQLIFTDHPAKLLIKIKPVFNGRPLHLDTDTYITDHGDSVTISRFKFYTGHFRASNGQQMLNDAIPYHLINTEDSASLSFVIDCPKEAELKQISFSIGVDSVDNVSGALDGALDPVKGMYWAWNTGYIHAKLEGRSHVCKTLHHAFEFHIGGYLSPNIAQRTVTLALPELRLAAGKTSCIELNADVAEWFKTPGIIDLSTTNNIVNPGKQAMLMADNYSNMFSVKAVSNP